MRVEDERTVVYLAPDATQVDVGLVGVDADDLVAGAVRRRPDSRPGAAISPTSRYPSTWCRRWGCLGRRTRCGPVAAEDLLRSSCTLLTTNNYEN